MTISSATGLFWLNGFNPVLRADGGTSEEGGAMRRLPRKLLANDHRMARTPHGNGPAMAMMMAVAAIDMAVTMVMAVPMVVPAMLCELGRRRVEGCLGRRVERGRIRLGRGRGRSGGCGLGARQGADRCEATEKAQNKGTSIQSILQ
ncbi:hypothetical protein [Bosea sp. (in: a-proteobacteria)]|uniref:hypothetical protein n=1 Tax=Bosea sp. (in: a-proteobacteria) TaxID=1871050 RepID=UPI001AC285D4|nr:hypothetical protein [Bosea sp. (in: a-proteobacteria)]MBN9435447.1 hypothetical protein [Bosea sp. (in: a-proteobacteria)]